MKTLLRILGTILSIAALIGFTCTNDDVNQLVIFGCSALALLAGSKMLEKSGVLDEDTY